MSFLENQTKNFIESFNNNNNDCKIFEENKYPFQFSYANYYDFKIKQFPEKKIGAYTLSERREKILKYKEKISNRRKKVFFKKHFPGRKLTASSKKRIRGKFVTEGKYKIFEKARKIKEDCIKKFFELQEINHFIQKNRENLLATQDQEKIFFLHMLTNEYQQKVSEFFLFPQYIGENCKKEEFIYDSYKLEN